MNLRQRISVLLLAIGLGFAILGQYYFAYRRTYVRDGVLFWSIALCAFGLLLRRMTLSKRRERPVQRQPVMVALSPRMLAAGAALALALLAGWAAQWPGRVDFSSVLWLWLVGVLWYPLSFVPSTWLSGSRTRLSRLLRWLRTNRREVFGLVGLLLVALAVRAMNLEHVPANLSGDEGTQGVAALEFLGPPLGNPFATGWFSVPTMSFLAYGISIRTFGESVAGLRMLSALVGTLTVPTTFLLARAMWGQRVAWMAAIALTCSHFHIHFSRLGSNQIFDGFFMTLALWLLIRALRAHSRLGFALMGIVVGMGWYSYFGARIVGVVIACYLVWRLRTEQDFLARYGRLLMIALGGALVAVGPLLLFYVQHPGDLLARSQQVSIFASGWLEREQVITGRSTTSLMLQQLWRAVSAFNYTLDPTFWYHATIPLLDHVSGLLFVFGLLWTVGRCRRPSNGLLLIWFWGALGLGWVITENPPSSQRMTVIAPALALMVGLGLDWLVRIGLRAFRWTKSDAQTTMRYGWQYSVGALLVVIAALNLHYYFLVYTPTRVYGNPTAEVATELGRYLVEQDDELDVYFYGPPYLYWGFGTLAYLARGIDGIDMPPLEDEEVVVVPDPNRGTRFFFLPERLEELESIRRRYPEGKKRGTYSSVDGRLLYVLYEVGQ